MAGRRQRLRRLGAPARLLRHAVALSSHPTAGGGGRTGSDPIGRRWARGAKARFASCICSVAGPYYNVIHGQHYHDGPDRRRAPRRVEGQGASRWPDRVGGGRPADPERGATAGSRPGQTPPDDGDVRHLRGAWPRRSRPVPPPAVPPPDRVHAKAEAGVTRACIDTHALIWYLSRPKKLGRAATRRLREADAGRAEILVPAIVLIELTLLREAGRNVIGAPQVEALLAAQPAFQLQPLELPQAREFALLDSLPDPFDRLIVAAARSADAPLITADTLIDDSALVETIWD
ncbi:MAG: type II toxin-antitoxin system VapC family toxin [Deltaproteobacteria bacterium]|nr:MAG: type II toxin-antitoxin system VapC family toxin [Deltaproteobacteria bacterium]